VARLIDGEDPNAPRAYASVICITLLRKIQFPSLGTAFKQQVGGAAWSSPEILETGRRQFGIAHRVLDVLVPEIGLLSCPLFASAKPQACLNMCGCTANLKLAATFRARCICWGSPLRRYGLGFGLAPAYRTVHVGDLR
jgi:hypothetical protein